MSRILSLVAVTFILALSLAACVNEQEEEGAEPTATAARAAIPSQSPVTAPALTPSATTDASWTSWGCTAPGVRSVSEVVVGIGVYLGQNPVTGETVVLSPLVGCPAYQAGVQAGDVILAVDGKPANEWREAEAGTEMTLGVRHGDGREENITITRETIGFPQWVWVDNIGMALLDGTVPGVIVATHSSSHTRAERAGIEHHDLILAVAGESTADWTPRDAADRIAGLGGELFTMTVRHIDGVSEDITIRPASEFCPLVIPGTYMGVAYLDGQVAPAGVTIEAVQGGVTWGTATTDEAGRYVIDAPQSLRDSPPCSPDGPVSFHMGDLLANESAEWHDGPTELDLTFGSPPPTPAPTTGH